MNSADLSTEGIQRGSFYKRSTKFRGMETSGADRLCEMEAENNRFQEVLAEGRAEQPRRWTWPSS